MVSERTKTRSGAESGLYRAASFIRLLRLMSADMPMQQAEVLIQVAMNPKGVHMSDLATKCALSPASVSRNVASLSLYHRLDKPGLGLVEVNIDPRDPRRRMASLTQKGRVFITKLLQTIDPDFSLDSETDMELAASRIAEAGLRSEIDQGSTRGKIGKL